MAPIVINIVKAVGRQNDKARSCSSEDQGGGKRRAVILVRSVQLLP